MPLSTCDSSPRVETVIIRLPYVVGSSQTRPAGTGLCHFTGKDVVLDTGDQHRQFHLVILYGIPLLCRNSKPNILVHYFDENEIEEGGRVNCNIVVSKPELSEEDKAELKEQAMEQYKEEQLRELRRQSQPKAQSKPTPTAPKAGAEINVQPNLFDF